MNTENLVQRANQLIDLGQDVLKTKHHDSQGIYTFVNTGKIKGFRASCLSFIEMLYGSTHSYYKEFNKVTEGYYPEHAEAGIEIVRSIKDEITGGWLTSIKGLVSAEIFSDFLEMSEYLLSNDYKDSAAVIIGSVLEEHLRQLCIKKGIEIYVKKDDIQIPKRTDALNQDLASENVYNKLDQKNVTAWLDLRNKAAHGKYDEYNKEQVDTMLRGVSEFVARLAI
jgi:hypothetical protein